MDTVQSFKGYGKVDELEESAFKKKLRKRLIFLSITLVVLISLIGGIVAGVLVHRRNSGDSKGETNSSSSAIRTICSITPYPGSCVASLSSSELTDPEQLFRYSLTAAMGALEKVSNLPEAYANKSNDPLVQEAARVCGEVLNDATDFLNDTLSSEGSLDSTKVSDLRTWLSTVVTDQETCFDALEEANATFVGDIRSLFGKSTELASNSLAIVSRLLDLLANFKLPFGNRRRLMEKKPVSELESKPEDLPVWITASDRRILQTQTTPTPNVIVSQNGKVKTIKAALAMVPPKSKKRFVIQLKKGTYKENVDIPKNLWNLMIVGEGMADTIISGGLNFIEGVTTFKTATLAVVGKGFILKGVTVINTAGPEKHQAVALRSGADLSIFFQCKFDGFQDTLYTHTNRQYYRDCDILGTIDFIFGNAAAVFQLCRILPRQPMANQFNTITAQGKKDPNQNTGISIQGCVIRAFGTVNVSTYLGRPWKDFSTTVIMQTSISAVVNPVGWISWIVGVQPVKTIMYGEFMNTGAGAKVDQRVKWSGYFSKLTAAQANKYKLETFIDGPTWIKETGVTYGLN